MFLPSNNRKKMKCLPASASRMDCPTTETLFDDYIRETTDHVNAAVKFSSFADSEQFAGAKRRATEIREKRSGILGIGEAACRTRLLRASPEEAWPRKCRPVIGEAGVQLKPQGNNSAKEGQPMEFKDGNVTASLEEIVQYNMLLTEAIFELLAEKDILTGAEVKERIQKLKVEATLNFRRPS